MDDKNRQIVAMEIADETIHDMLNLVSWLNNLLTMWKIKKIKLFG